MTRDNPGGTPPDEPVTDDRDIYIGDFNVARFRDQWAVVHRPSGMMAPADMACPWIEWAEGRGPLAFYPSKVAAREWFERARKLAHSDAAVTS